MRYTSNHMMEALTHPRWFGKWWASRKSQQSVSKISWPDWYRRVTPPNHRGCV